MGTHKHTLDFNSNIIISSSPTTTTTQNKSMFSSGLGRVKSRQEFRPSGDDDDDDDNNNVVTLSALPRNQRTKNSFDEFLPMISYRQGMAKGSDVVVRSLAFFLKKRVR